MENSSSSTAPTAAVVVVAEHKEKTKSLEPDRKRLRQAVIVFDVVTKKMLGVALKPETLDAEKFWDLPSDCRRIILKFAGVRAFSCFVQINRKANCLYGRDLELLEFYARVHNAKNITPQTHLIAVYDYLRGRACTECGKASVKTKMFKCQYCTHGEMVGGKIFHQSQEKIGDGKIFHQLQLTHSCVPQADKYRGFCSVSLPCGMRLCDTCHQTATEFTSKRHFCISKDDRITNYCKMEDRIYAAKKVHDMVAPKEALDSDSDEDEGENEEDACFYRIPTIRWKIPKLIECPVCEEAMHKDDKFLCRECEFSTCRKCLSRCTLCAALKCYDCMGCLKGLICKGCSQQGGSNKTVTK